MPANFPHSSARSRRGSAPRAIVPEIGHVCLEGAPPALRVLKPELDRGGVGGAEDVEQLRPVFVVDELDDPVSEDGCFVAADHL